MEYLPLKLNDRVSRSMSEIASLESTTYDSGVPQISPIHGGTTA